MIRNMLFYRSFVDVFQNPNRWSKSEEMRRVQGMDKSGSYTQARREFGEPKEWSDM